MRIKETKLYKFDELSDRAKENARDWWRQMEAESQDNSFAEFVIDDAEKIAEILGIELKTRPVKLMGGGTRYDPCIWWSLVYSQGDGASFEGRYRYAAGSVKKLKEHAPQDEKLHRIVEGLAAIQRRNFYRGVIDIGQRGNYTHSYSMDFSDVSDRELSGEDYGGLCELLRDFADWIYRQLQAEYEYQNADAQVDEAIQANEYEFTEEGRRS